MARAVGPAGRQGSVINAAHLLSTSFEFILKKAAGWQPSLRLSSVFCRRRRRRQRCARANDDFDRSFLSASAARAARRSRCPRASCHRRRQKQKRLRRLRPPFWPPPPKAACRPHLQVLPVGGRSKRGNQSGRSVARGFNSANVDGANESSTTPTTPKKQKKASFYANANQLPLSHFSVRERERAHANRGYLLLRPPFARPPARLQH